MGLVGNVFENAPQAAGLGLMAVLAEFRIRGLRLRRGRNCDLAPGINTKRAPVAKSRAQAMTTVLLIDIL